MATTGENVYEVEEMLNQPGTYFNPQSEVVVIVDDSASIDQEVFNVEGYEGAEWVRVSDEVPVDEDGRDRALESFEARSQGGEALAPDALEESDDDLEEGGRAPRGRPSRGRGVGVLSEGDRAPAFTLPDQHGKR